MSIINDLGNKNLKEQTRVYNLEINLPHNGKSSLLFRKEKLLLVDTKIISQTQIDPIIKNYYDESKTILTVFDPITRREISISVVALINAIQKLGQ
jgi:hypothetical protein